MLPPCLVSGDRPSPCARTVMEQRIEGRYDLTGDFAGWKIRAGKLLGPGGAKFSPASLQAAWRWWATPAIPTPSSRLLELLQEFASKDDLTSPSTE